MLCYLVLMPERMQQFKIGIDLLLLDYCSYFVCESCASECWIESVVTTPAISY